MKISLLMPLCSILICLTTACAPPGAKTKVSGGRCSAEFVEHLNRLTTEAYELLDSNKESSSGKLLGECRMLNELMTGTSGCSVLDQSNNSKLVTDQDIQRFCAYDPNVFLREDGSRLVFHYLSPETHHQN